MGVQQRQMPSISNYPCLKEKFKVCCLTDFTGGVTCHRKCICTVLMLARSGIYKWHLSQHSKNNSWGSEGLRSACLAISLLWYCQKLACLSLWLLQSGLWQISQKTKSWYIEGELYINICVCLCVWVGGWVFQHTLKTFSLTVPESLQWSLLVWLKIWTLCHQIWPRGSTITDIAFLPAARSKQTNQITNQETPTKKQEYKSIYTARNPGWWAEVLADC